MAGHLGVEETTYVRSALCRALRTSLMEIAERTGKNTEAAIADVPTSIVNMFDKNFPRPEDIRDDAQRKSAWTEHVIQKEQEHD